eukprot:m.34005 g.34005  ORF g.34005 m.34005 type:complete len:122 (-) comp12611_c0_seq1:2710-3075(-)
MGDCLESPTTQWLRFGFRVQVVGKGRPSQRSCIMTAVPTLPPDRVVSGDTRATLNTDSCRGLCWSQAARLPGSGNLRQASPKQQRRHPRLGVPLRTASKTSDIEDSCVILHRPTRLAQQTT